MTYLKKPASPEELLHYGVKGMKWGVRKDQEDGVYRLQGPGPTIDSTLPQSTKSAGKEVASLIGERYGFKISALKSIEPGHPEYGTGTIGFVQGTPGRREGVIYTAHTDVRKQLKHGEDIGWFGKDCGNVRAFLTHESAHAIFHAEQKVKTGFAGPRIVGGNIKARDKAIKAAIKAAQRDGIPSHLFSSKVSDYAATSGMREEVEAELFSQYHWSSNPPSFVTVWGETLHRELGLNDTPFREEVKHD
jgi:hypothetical protein